MIRKTDYKIRVAMKIEGLAPVRECIHEANFHILLMVLYTLIHKILSAKSVIHNSYPNKATQENRTMLNFSGHMEIKSFCAKILALLFNCSKNYTKNNPLTSSVYCWVEFYHSTERLIYCTAAQGEKQSTQDTLKGSLH